MFSLPLLQNGIAIMELAATALNPYKPEAVESGTSVNQIRWAWTHGNALPGL